MATKTRKRYTDEERTTILAAIEKDGLSAVDAAKKFGISEPTYYQWRQKARGTQPTPRTAGANGLATSTLTENVRATVQAKLKKIIPAVVKYETDSMIAAFLGTPVRGRPVTGATTKVRITKPAKKKK